MGHIRYPARKGSDPRNLVIAKGIFFIIGCIQIEHTTLACTGMTMSGKTPSASNLLFGTNQLENFSPVSLMAVGEPGTWEQLGKSRPHRAMAFVGFNDVTAAILDRLSPSLIVSPVLAQTFDCIELATLLHQLGFTGSYRAVADCLPKPDLIEREVRQICGRLDFRIVKSH